MHAAPAHHCALPHIRLFPRRRRRLILVTAAAAAIAALITATVIACLPPGPADAAGSTAVLTAVIQPDAAQAASAYRIRRGDTLSAIAARLCGNPADYTGLAAANGIADPDFILAGATLYHISCYRTAVAVPRGYRSTYVPYRHHRYRVVYASGSYRGSGGCQSLIIRRESGGNARAVNPRSGAGGLYQFLPSTWHSLGHSGLPQNASVAEQTRAFHQEVAQDHGYSAWAASGGCG